MCDGIEEGYQWELYTQTSKNGHLRSIIAQLSASCTGSHWLHLETRRIDTDRSDRTLARLARHIECASITSLIQGCQLSRSIILAQAAWQDSLDPREDQHQMTIESQVMHAVARCSSSIVSVSLTIIASWLCLLASLSTSPNIIAWQSFSPRQNRCM